MAAFFTLIFYHFTKKRIFVLMTISTNKKKHILLPGKKILPSYLINKKSTTKIILFTTVFSLVFINIFRPFNSETWIPGITPLNYFLYSSLMVIIGMLVISLSRTLMYFFVKKISIGYIEYIIWIFAEIVILSIFYVFIANKVGFVDNFMAEHGNIKYWEALFDIFRKSIANTMWMLLIPYIISFLYLENEYLKQQIGNIADIDNEKNVIQFKDEKNEVRFSVTSDKILYIESADNYCIIKYLNNEKVSDFILRNSLKKIANELIRSSIQRCHRSFMVNFEHITSLKKNNGDICLEFDIPNIKDIPVSKSYNDKIMEAFVVYSGQK